MLKTETFKVAIVGLGRVGVTTAYALLLKGLCTELVLFSRELAKAEGEKADLMHGAPFYPHVTITATDKFEDLSGTDLVIFTAGYAQKPGQTRLDLTKGNCDIVKALIPKIVKHAPHTLILMVANPLDIMTYQATQFANLPAGRVIGSGTLLDTARFRPHRHLMRAERQHAGEEDLPGRHAAVLAPIPSTERLDPHRQVRMHDAQRRRDRD